MGRNSIRGALLCCASVLVWGAPVPVAAQGQQTLVIQGGTLVDGNGGAPVPNSIVVIQGNRIAAAGPAAQVQAPAGARVINAAGKFIIPGLIDAKSNYYWEYGEVYLVWGVTSAMISGARNDVGIAERDAINHGVFTGPRLYQTMVSISGPGADGKKRDTFAPGLGTRIAYTPDDARKMVDAFVAAGADFITLDDGDGDPAIFAAAAAEAHKLGKKVAFRAVGPQVRAHEAAEMDSDVLIHMGQAGNEVAKDLAKWKNGAPFGGGDPFNEVDPAKVPGMVKFLVQHHAALEPELITGMGQFSKNPKRYRDETRAMFNDPDLLAYFPKFRIDNLLQKVVPPEETLTPQQIAERKQAFQNKADFLHKFVQAGGHLVAGTDCPQAPPGLGVQMEMALFQEDVGATPMQALQSGTKWVADAFGAKDIGTIEPGKLADIDILDADPTVDINNAKKINAVIQDGKVVDRRYHAWYKSPFGKSVGNAGNPVIPDVSWAGALKQATGGGGRGGAAGANAAAQNPIQSPTPGVESMMPYELAQGSADTPITLKGFNFVQRSLVYVDGIPVPTRVLSRTEIQAVVPANVLAKAGRFEVVVKNPEPLATPEWGGSSNEANLLVPFSFTTAYSKNTL